MKWMIGTLLFSMSTLAAAQDYTRVECVSQTYSGKIVTLSACVVPSADAIADGSVVACAGDYSEFVTITRETHVAKQTPDMIETVKIPGRLFRVGWVDDQLTLELDDIVAGKVTLVFTNPDVVSEQTLNIDLPSMKHEFKAVGCTFQ